MVHQGHVVDSNYIKPMIIRKLIPPALPTRGTRNCNPLNIRYLPTSKWKGLAGHDDKGFCVFKSMPYGIRAAISLLRSYNQKHHIYHMASIINRWAPPIENDTQSYIASITYLSGLEPNDDVLWYSTRAVSLIEAMAWLESRYIVTEAEVSEALSLL